jgi:hypothetical protein
MINRRGAIFNRDHLRYAEIADVAEAPRNCGTCGHARPIKEGDYAAFLACLPKSDLLKGARDADFLTRVDHGRSRCRSALGSGRCSVESTMKFLYHRSASHLENLR